MTNLERVGELAPPSLPEHGRHVAETIDIESVPPIGEIDLTFADLDFLSFYDEDEVRRPSPNSDGTLNPNYPDPPMMARMSVEPHISPQFYTFNEASHSLMTTCLIEGRLPSPEEIRAVSVPSVLAKWSSVWGDRNEETAYMTAWKRIQDKLTVYEGDPPDTAIGNDNPFICFKNNFNQFVSHIDQWQDIVMAFHSNADSKHLGLGETIGRIKHVWSVGCKFYGIPESFIRACVAACPVCSDKSSGKVQRSRKGRFEYTKSFEVPAKEVPITLQQLALEHKAKLSIRQKYLRYNPFMAEVKDYTCQRAGDPGPSKRPRALKRGHYASRRCGCGFRIRVIVPISNYNEKDNTYVYKEEGTAVFKMYAVDSEPEHKEEAVATTEDERPSRGSISVNLFK